MRVLWIGMLLTSVVAEAQNRRIEIHEVEPAVLEKRLRLAHPKSAIRFERLKALFAEEGCANLREQPVRGSKEPNLICPVDAPDANAGLIVVGAHFDCYNGDGLIDNWTSAILLPSLAKFIRSQPRKHNFQFVGFAAEEKGLVGSKAFLKAIPKEDRGKIRAVIAMDSLGMAPTKFWPNSSDKTLANYAFAVAASMKLGFEGINTENIGTTDSATFHNAGIPTLSLHSITQDNWHLINKPTDTLGILRWQDYYESHRLIMTLIAYLDQELP